MSKKIVILNGSPRKNGNTSALIKAFTEGAESAGNIVTTFFLEEMNIHACKGCFGNVVNTNRDPNSPCIQKDDMDKIYPAYNEADIVVLASPLYYWQISGQLKCAFDRLVAIAECTENYKNPKKESILLMAAEGWGFEETVYWYERLMDHIKWKSLGSVLCGGVLKSGDIEGNEKLEEARKLGASIK
jgi:multimeric flavodoxin WrbA